MDIRNNVWFNEYAQNDRASRVSFSVTAEKYFHSQ